MPRMTGKELKRIRESLHLSKKDLGLWLAPARAGMDRDIRRWEAGDVNIPYTTATLMNMFAAKYKPTHLKKEQSYNAPVGPHELKKALSKYKKDYHMSVEEICAMIGVTENGIKRVIIDGETVPDKWMVQPSIPIEIRGGMIRQKVYQYEAMASRIRRHGIGEKAWK